MDANGNNEMTQLDNAYANYDAVFKDAVTLFSDKALDFFGLPGDMKILEPLRSEKKEVRVETEFSDLTFRLSDGRGLHAEEEVDLSKDDLLRFCGYHVDLARVYKCEFITVIFVKNLTDNTKLDMGMLKFEPHVIDCGAHDADKILEALKSKVQNGDPINELEVIYLPLFKSAKHSPEYLLQEAVMLVKQLKDMDEDRKLKMIALALMVSNKFVDKEKLSKIWEVAKMMKLKILEVAEEMGIEQGIERGIEQGIEQGIERGIEQGVDLSANIVRDLLNNVSANEVAARYQVAIDMVMQFQSVLAN